jgi:hypothetical protein
MDHIKRFFIWLLSLIGLQTEEIIKFPATFLYSNKFSNELMDDAVVEHSSLKDAVTVSDHLRLRDDLKVHFDFGNRKYTAQILYSDQHTLELDDVEKTLHGSVLVIYNEDETHIQRMDEYPTKKMAYLRSIANNENEFNSTLGMDFYPVRGPIGLKKMNLSLVIHVCRWLR